MKYRTKIYLGIGCLVIFIVLSIESINYVQSRTRYYEDLKSKVNSITTTGAVLLDKQDVATVSKELNKDSPAYERLIHQLRIIRDANRRKATYVNYIYLIRPDLQDPKSGFVIIADATSEKKTIFAPPGTKYPEGLKFGINEHLDRPYAPGFITDRWGRFYAAYAPVFGQDGRYLATLGVSIDYAFIEKRLAHIRWLSLGSMIVALAAGMFIAGFLARKISASLSKIYAGISKIEQGDLQTGMHVSTQDEFSNLEYAINTMARGIEEKEQSKLNLMRYVSRPILHKLIETGKTPDFDGELRKITVMFTDLRDFGILTDRLSPKEVVSILNEFFEKMVEILLENGGTLDKYIGDGIMAQFGAPLEEAHKEDIAIETARKMQEALLELNKKWDEQGYPQLRMYIGIHTGEAIIGNIGSSKRQEYTALGNTVKIAARLAEVALQLDVPVLASGDTWNRTHEPFKSKELGPLHIKGQKDPIQIFCISLIGEECD